MVDELFAEIARVRNVTNTWTTKGGARFIVYYYLFIFINH